ncbi:YvcK family protein [Clostridiales bacterium COT073_COT-073]|nr:YvcK family protein [Clostridiales bacterium COT073_COT-073]
MKRRKDERKVVCVGGGTGLSTLLRGLKFYAEDITAIVTVADNGGSSGQLRREMGILPPGDIRNCVLALAEIEPLMEEVYQYRFSEGSLKGQNLGNLIIAALSDISGSFEKAVEQLSDILAVKGKVLPVTNEKIELMATYADGSRIFGEEEIVYQNKVSRKKIQTIEMLPKTPLANSKAVQALEEADLIVLGPGSLYTSIIPNLLVKGIPEAIRGAKAKVIYVGNLMTQPGETDFYGLSDHIDAIERILGKKAIDVIAIDGNSFSPESLKFYAADDSYPVPNDLADATEYTIAVGDLSITDGVYIRHNPKALAEFVLRI